MIGRIWDSKLVPLLATYLEIHGLALNTETMIFSSRETGEPVGEVTELTTGTSNRKINWTFKLYKQIESVSVTVEVRP